MGRRPVPGARERILDTATPLFAERGVHAVGLQEIIEAGGCGKNMLYRVFGSKDELVVAFLERVGEESDATLARVAEQFPDPADQLVGIVAEQVRYACQDGFRGCGMRNAFSEFPDPEHPAHRTVVGFYRRRQEHLTALARRAGARDPELLAARISLILDGLNGQTPILGATRALDDAVAFARLVVAEATRPSEEDHPPE